MLKLKHIDVFFFKKFFKGFSIFCTLSYFTSIPWAEIILNCFSFWLSSYCIVKNGFFCFVVLKKFLKCFCHVLKYSIFFRFIWLLDLTGVDFFWKKNRFEIFYMLASVLLETRVNVRCFTNEWSSLHTVSNLFSSAIWFEREVFDMFGVSFLFHKDLRRILTDYGFTGFPLRKDFPLTGYYEIRYDDSINRVVTESLSLVQEMRFFSFLSPWI